MTQNKFTRDDLQFGDIVILRNGERCVVASNQLYLGYPVKIVEEETK